MDLLELSRLQFALTALYHFLFVPLTIGLSLLIAIMESVYVMTGRRAWRELARFWGVLFGINFAMGVATGITMEFQFGTNWAYYAHYVGDSFGAPLAIEGLMAGVLEGTFVGLFFFGWDRLSKVGHLVVTWLVSIGSNLSALWILVANGWMQNPVGATFNPDTMRMELSSFREVLLNPVAQSKYVHTIAASYVTGAVFVLAVSAFYLLNHRHREFARRSMTVAASFGLAAAISVVALGDESGYTTTQNQKMKLAAMEAEWHTQPAPAGFNVFAVPDVEARENRYEVQVPWVLGLIATRRVDQEVPGILDLVDKARNRVRTGMIAYAALERVRADPSDTDARDALTAHAGDLGYALLLKRYREDVANATPDQVEQAAWSTVPNVGLLFWLFRLMVGIGFYLILLFAVAFSHVARRNCAVSRRFLWAALLSLPLPWIAAEVGWIVAEVGRQPWAIEGVLPTFLAVSHVGAGSVAFTLVAFVLLYSSLAVADVYLMVRTIRKGPSPAAEEA
jgi:cytochrome d ubiquinol oxidase subunit I